MDNELDEGFNEAPQPIVTIRLSYICSNDQHSSCCNVQGYDIDHTIKTAASPHSLPASRTHIDIYLYLHISSIYIYTYSYVCIHNISMYILYRYIYTHIYMCTYVIDSTCVNTDIHKYVRTYNEYAQMCIYIC